MKHARSNKRIETAVTMGIAASSLSGLSEGARIMRQARVPMDVALRVLLRPQARRTTDWRQ